MDLDKDFDMESFISKLTSHKNFELFLQERFQKEFKKNTQYTQIGSLQNKSEQIFQDIHDTLQQLINLNVKQVTTNQFMVLSEDTLETRTQIFVLKKEVLQKYKQVEDNLQTIKREMNELRTKMETKNSDQKQVLENRGRALSNSRRQDNHQIKFEMLKMKTEMEQLKVQIKQQQKKIKYCQEFSSNLKSKLQQSNEIYKKAAQFDFNNLPHQEPQFLDLNKYQDIVKNIVGYQMHSITETLEDHRKFIATYQQQFSQLERAIKNQIQCKLNMNCGSLQTIWKVITDIRVKIASIKLNEDQLDSSEQ